MHRQTAEHIETIRSEVLRRKATLSDWKTQLAANTDKYVNQLLLQASNWLNDVEVLYLGLLKNERTPPRTFDEESRELWHAEFFLNRVAIPHLEAIQEMVAKYGPGVRSIG